MELKQYVFFFGIFRVFFGEFDFMTNDDSRNKALNSGSSNKLTCRNKLEFPSRYSDGKYGYVILQTKG